MELSPKLYNWLVRPDWYNTNFTINILKDYNFEDKKILDFGCGTGSNCFLSTPENYLGVDINENRIKYAREKYPGYHFETLNNYHLPTNSFDIILIIAVLHHIPDNKINSIFNEFRRILKCQTGVIIVIEPCYYKQYKFNNYFMRLLDKGKYIRRPEDYINIFKKEKYAVSNIEKISKLAYKEILFTASDI